MKIVEEIINEAIKKLEFYVSKENYSGWDPYDALCTKRIPKRILNNRLLAIVLIQFNLYSPINFRDFLRIDKNTSNKALALFSRAYYLMGHIFQDPNYLSKGSMLLTHYLNRTEKICNSYYFTYIAPKHFLGPQIDDIICITEGIKTLSLAYIHEKRSELQNKLNLLLEKLFKNLMVEESEYAYFKYTLLEKEKIVFNVSALALEAISETMKFHKNYDYPIDIMNIVKKVVKFLLMHQREDGAWPYSIYREKNKYYWQIDYHQGFIIDGLNSILPYLDVKSKEEVERALEKGIKFYMTKQFTRDGYSYYRYPFKYPIDIHNQAQGIITFSKIYKSTNNEEYLDFAKKIALWTIKNMQSPEGYFYTHKWPLLVNKIPYMRWGQAWMMLALATLLGVLKFENSNDRAL